MPTIFDPIYVHFDGLKQKFYPYETMSDISFLTSLGLPADDCVLVGGLTVDKLRREARFPIPYLAAAIRNGVSATSTDLVDPGDVVEFQSCSDFTSASLKLPGNEGVYAQSKPNHNITPRWDDEARSLWAGDKLIKCFTKPAPDQVLVLQSFQELDWPARIDDPLDPGKRDSAVVSLNRNHTHPGVVRFGRDGTSKRIKWFFVNK